jgi:hypothetical protein
LSGVRHLSSGAVGALAEAFITASHRGVAGLLALPRRLQRPRRDFNRTLVRQLNGIEEPPFQLPPSWQRDTEEEKVSRMVKRSTAAFRAKHLARAVNILSADVPSDLTMSDDAVHTALADLFPAPEEGDTARAVPVDPILLVTTDELVAAAKKMAKGEAPGPSGLASDVLWQAIEADESGAVAEVLAALVRDILSGSLSPEDADRIRAARLVALPKPKRPDSVRPVVMSETLLKLAAIVSLERAGKALHDMPHQYGLRKGGQEQAIHAVREKLRSGFRVKTFDATNAYNRTWRTAMFKKLAQMDNPELDAFKNYVNFAYGGSSAAFWQGRDGRMRSLLIRRGFRQGDPASPACFCLAIQDDLERLARRFPGLEIYAYLDDITLVGPDDVVLAATPVLIEYLAAVGLTLREEQDSAKAGITLLGAAITSLPTQTDPLLRKVRPLSKYSDFLQRVGVAPNVMRLQLLRVCGVTRGAYVARTHGTEGESWLREFDSMTLEAASGIVGVSADRLRTRPKVFLPVRMGGLGLTSYAELAEVAHRSSLTLTPQDALVEAFYAKKYDGTTVVQRAPRQLEHWLTGEAFVPETAFISMLRSRLGFMPLPGRLLSAHLRCPACPRTMTAAALFTHLPQCVCVSGPGNPTFRHNQAKGELQRALVQRGVFARAEVPIPGTEDLRMDIVLPGLWIDITVTTDELKRFKDKQRLYGKHAKAQGATLRVLAFSPEGHILQRSWQVAKRLAKSADAAAGDIFGPISAHIAQSTAIARDRAAAYVRELHHDGLLLGCNAASTSVSDVESVCSAGSDVVPTVSSAPASAATGASKSSIPHKSHHYHAGKASNAGNAGKAQSAKAQLGATS